MKAKLLFIFIFASVTNIFSQSLFQASAPTTHTRWISPENPSGEKGKGALTNKGAKGNAFFIIQPGEKKVLFDVKGAGIINRMWFSGSIATNSEQRRAVRIDMYWDGAKKPAVSAPIGDFFGQVHGVMSRFDNELFSSPEARSFNFTIPMPFRKSGLVTIINESSSEVHIWYDINFLKMKAVPQDAMYFHAFWNRDLKTKLGEDYQILPKVNGCGRYLGANIGVIGDSLYNGTWFGEGEVKVYLDGDTTTPTLTGTGTEDYIGTGYGQGEYACRYFGSPVSNSKFDIYAFYRYHIVDPVYFHNNCKVTIQQIGNSKRDVVRKVRERGAEMIPVWYHYVKQGEKSYHGRLLDEQKSQKLEDKDFPDVYTNFYRRDDVCATAYFYLDKPSSNLSELPSKEIRLKDLKKRVWEKMR
jgi:hypothetical protein